MAKAIARWQADRPHPLDWAWLSTARRTVDTGAVLLERVGLPSHLQLADRRIYLANPGTLLEVVRETPRDRQWAMLIGHNPGLTLFANQLAGKELHPDLPTLAMVTLSFPEEEWASIGYGQATLVELWTPKGMPKD